MGHFDIIFLIMRENEDAILLCGKDDKSGFNGNCKYLLEVGESQKIIHTTLDALEKSELISRIIIVGEEDAIRPFLRGREKDYHFIKPRGSIVDNLSAGIEKQQQINGDRNILMVCSDLPFLTEKSLDWVVINSNTDDNIDIPIVSEEDLLALSPTYESYYYPMKEYPFKMGNNIFINTSLLDESRIRLLVERYRETGSDNYLLMSLKRFALLQEYGGFDAVYTLMMNFVSKGIQREFGKNSNIPFSSLRSKKDYERIISKIMDYKTSLLRSPHIDMVLDVDSALRYEIFKRGYSQIWDKIRNNAVK